MVGRRRLVHAIGARGIQDARRSATHSLASSIASSMSEVAAVRSRETSGLRHAALAHERMHLDGVEVDGAAREANCCALLGELVRQGEKRGKVHALGRSAGNLLRQRQAAVRARAAPGGP